MGDCCPTCGQLMPRQMLDANQLYSLLSRNQELQVYRGQNGNWYVTRGNGQTTERAVQTLRQHRDIRPVYSNCPNDCFHIGRTLDCDATIELRKKQGNRTARVYVDDANPVSVEGT